MSKTALCSWPIAETESNPRQGQWYENEVFADDFEPPGHVLAQLGEPYHFAVMGSSDRNLHCRGVLSVLAIGQFSENTGRLDVSLWQEPPFTSVALTSRLRQVS